MLRIHGAVAEHLQPMLGRRPDFAAAPALKGVPANNEDPPYKFAYARTALKFGLQALKIERGQGVLVPEFICDSALEPLHQLGIVPQFYRVRTSLEPDWNAANSAVQLNTVALLIVHYFGQPQSLARCHAFCTSHSLLLIEDNAHGYGAIHEGQPLGTFGAAGLTAPRKSFSVPHGAYLYLQDQYELAAPQLTLRPSNRTLKQLAMNWARKVPGLGLAFNARRQRAERRRRQAPPPKYGCQSAFRDPPLKGDFAMDAGVHEYLASCALHDAMERRHEIYGIYEEWTSAHGLAPVFSRLAGGSMPLVFPALSDSASSSLHWFERGHRAGLDIHSWPTLPPEIVKLNGDALRIWERLVCFPIHQDLNPRAVQERLSVL